LRIGFPNKDAALKAGIGYDVANAKTGGTLEGSIMASRRPPKSPPASGSEAGSPQDEGMRLRTAWEAATEALLKALPDEYQPLTGKLADVDHIFRMALARRLEDAFNHQVGGMPAATYDDKRTLARWVNAELRRFGLALVCPKSKRPSVLLADPGGTPGVGRFQFQSESPEGRKVRAYSSATLPRLELTAAPEG